MGGLFIRREDIRCPQGLAPICKFDCYDIDAGTKWRRSQSSEEPQCFLDPSPEIIHDSSNLKKQ
jgi:hypothetical protein